MHDVMCQLWPHLLKHLELLNGRLALLYRLHVPLGRHLHVRQQVLDALSHALSMRSAPPPPLLALEDGLQLVVLLFGLIVWPGPAPFALVIALTATICLSLWK